MSDRTIPTYDPNDMDHWFLYHALAYEMNEEDFKAIQMALITRDDDHRKIDESSVMFVDFDQANGLMQPRDIPDHYKTRAHRYVNWNCAMEILLVISKYTHFCSNI